MTNSTHWIFALNLAMKSGWTDEQIAEHLHELVEAMDSLAEIHVPEVFESYFHGANSLLSGARPIDAIVLGEQQAVLEAIEGHKAGAYA